MIRETEPPKPSTKVTMFTVEGKAAVAAHHRTDLRALRRELSGDLDWITLRAMEKDRTRRYDSAAALAQDVLHYLNHEPVSATPPTVRYRMRKFIRKHRLGVSAVGGLVTMMVLGLLGTGYGLITARAERDNAISAKISQEIQRGEAVRAKDAAVAAKATAETAREQADSANEFLRDLLMSSGSSSGSAGLDAAVRKLDQGWLKDQPPTDAACRVALGYSYLNLSGIPVSESAAMARRQFNAALELLRKPDGSYPPAGAATVYRALGMLDMRERFRRRQRAI